MNELDRQIEEALKDFPEPTDDAEKGAACFRSINFASCTEGITKETADKLAAKFGYSVKFYSGKTCSAISCKP